MKSITIDQNTISITANKLLANTKELTLPIQVTKFLDVAYLGSHDVFLVIALVTQNNNEFVTYNYINNQLTIETIEQDPARVGVQDATIIPTNKGFIMVLKIFNKDSGLSIRAIKTALNTEYGNSTVVENIVNIPI